MHDIQAWGYSYVADIPVATVQPKAYPLCSTVSTESVNDLWLVLDDYYGEDEDDGDEDLLAPEQPPQLYIPDWNAFNAGANVAAAAANAVRGAGGNPCHGGGCGFGGNGILYWTAWVIW